MIRDLRNPYFRGRGFLGFAVLDELDLSAGDEFGIGLCLQGRADAIGTQGNAEDWIGVGRFHFSKYRSG